jgi:hypothetical protein
MLLEDFASDGFVILPSFLSLEDLAAGVNGLPALFPTAEDFHQGVDERRERFIGDEFAGIDFFPFADVELSLLSVHPKLVALARTLLGAEDVRLYSAEVWVKYTGAADYSQNLHRDALGHTVLVPSTDPAFRQIEIFLFLCDVPEDLGPPHYVPGGVTDQLPLLPNWLPQAKVPEVYAAEVSSTGPRGTVVAYSTDTLHRGTQLVAPEGARYTIHVNFRRADAEWALRRGWATIAHEPAWYDFVARATVEQLRLFGFPPSGHPYWTEQTLRDMQVRYPSFNPAAWRN